MYDVQLTGHAIERFQERFAGNLGWTAAAQRLAKLLRRARFLRVCAGKARLYTLGEMRFVVQDGALVTVYRPTYPPRPPLPTCGSNLHRSHLRPGTLIRR